MGRTMEDRGWIHLLTSLTNKHDPQMADCRPRAKCRLRVKCRLSDSIVEETQYILKKSAACVLLGGKGKKGQGYFTIITDLKIKILVSMSLLHFY